MPRLGEVVDRLDPNRFITFKSKLHDQRVASVLGVALGISFFLCFFTGLYSHFIQHPLSWMTIGPRPAGLYRFTQGLHVVSGLLAVPLLIAKLWTVFPKLFEWPPITSLAQALERISLPLLIGGALFQLVTGVANINQYYFFPFFFTTAHYAAAWITIGALIVHIGAKATIVRHQLGGSGTDKSDLSVATERGGLTRRGFLGAVFGTGAVVTTFTVGQSFTPLGDLALLAPRRPGDGPQHLPVNKSARGANVIQTAQSEDWRLTVDGRVQKPLTFTLEDIRALPMYEAALPISCVEGWSQTAHWRGVRVRDLMQMAGADSGVSVLVQSLEKNSLYAQSVLNRDFVTDKDTLLALELNGEPLDIDHGYPVRLIAPNRPGVMQTKWVHRLQVV